MGLLDKLKAAVDKGEQAVDSIVDTTRGIVSGDIDGIGRPNAPYADRLMTGAEKDLARKVFEETVPYGKIYLSNGLGLEHRPYTIPHPLHLGSYVIHIGDDTFPDATNSSIRIFGQTADSVFIHELTHVWQGVNRRTAFDYIFDSVYNQVRFGSHAYDLKPDEVGKKSWGEFNAEQQAMIVQNWYVAGMSENDKAFAYIRDNIRTRNA